MEQNIWVRRAISIGIIVVLNLFFNYTISLVFTEPQFTSYFSQPQVVQNFSTKESCLGVGGQWNESSIVDPTNTKIQGSCDPDFTNRTAYDLARKNYDKKVFVTLILLGALCIAGGAWIQNSLLKIAFMWGGVVSLLIASMRYWSAAGAFVKVFVLAIALAGLIFLALKKFNSEPGK